MESIPAPLSSHFVQIENTKIHYLTAGAGDPIVLIHGFPTSSYLWRNVIIELAGHYQVIALDLPGYGKSDKRIEDSFSFRYYSRILTGFMDNVGLANYFGCSRSGRSNWFVLDGEPHGSCGPADSLQYIGLCSIFVGGEAIRTGNFHSGYPGLACKPLRDKEGHSVWRLSQEEIDPGDHSKLPSAFSGEIHTEGTAKNRTTPELKRLRGNRRENQRLQKTSSNYLWRRR